MLWLVLDPQRSVSGLCSFFQGLFKMIRWLVQNEPTRKAALTNQNFSYKSQKLSKQKPASFLPSPPFWPLSFLSWQLSWEKNTKTTWFDLIGGWGFWLGRLFLLLFDLGHDQGVGHPRLKTGLWGCHNVRLFLQFFDGSKCFSLEPHMLSLAACSCRRIWKSGSSRNFRTMSWIDSTCRPLQKGAPEQTTRLFHVRTSSVVFVALVRKSEPAVLPLSVVVLALWLRQHRSRAESSLAFDEEM